MVNPLINGQKKNQVDVTKVLDELKSMRTQHEDGLRELQATKQHLELLPVLQERLKEAEISLNQQQRTQKIMQEALIDRCERNVLRIGEVSKEYQRLEGEMNARDYRVKNNTDMVMEFKEKVTTEISTFMRQVTRELDAYTLKTNKAAQDLITMNSFFQAAQVAVNGFQQELTKVTYSASRVDDIVTNFMNQDLLQLKERLDKLELKAGTHDLSI